MIDPTQMLDEIKDLQHRLHKSIHRNAEHTEKIRELQVRITELEAQLQKSQRRTRQLYGALEGARRIASEYYAFGLTGFEGDYTQTVNQLKDEPDWEDK